MKSKKPLIALNADIRGTRKDSPAFSFVQAGYYDSLVRSGAVRRYPRGWRVHGGHAVPCERCGAELAGMQESLAPVVRAHQA